MMLAKGASILNEKDGGGAIFESFVHPTVLYPVNEEMKIYHEEPFGPIIPIVPLNFWPTGEYIQLLCGFRFITHRHAGPSSWKN